MTTTHVVTITDDTTRTDLATTLALLNADAKAISRRGITGTSGHDYARQHARINTLIDEWLRAPA